jgi:hypothetical protein
MVAAATKTPTTSSSHRQCLITTISPFAAGRDNNCCSSNQDTYNKQPPQTMLNNRPIHYSNNRSFSNFPSAISPCVDSLFGDNIHQGGSFSHDSHKKLQQETMSNNIIENSDKQSFGNFLNPIGPLQPEILNTQTSYTLQTVSPVPQKTALNRNTYIPSRGYLDSTT